MPEQTVTISPTPTLLTQVAGTPVPSVGIMTVMVVDGRYVRIGRGTAVVAPTVWWPMSIGEGALARPLDEISPGGAGDHLWADCKSETGQVNVSWT